VGTVLLLDLAKDEAEVRLLPLHAAAAAAAGGAPSAAPTAATGVGGEQGAGDATAMTPPEVRIVPLDSLRPLPGATLPMGVVEDLGPEFVSRAMGALGQWAFLEVREQDEAGGGGKGGDRDGAAESDAATVGHAALLLRALQCQALRLAHAFLLARTPPAPVPGFAKAQGNDPILSALLGTCSGSDSGSSVSGPDHLLRRLLAVATRPTDAGGLADLPLYEEQSQLLLLYRQLLPGVAAAARAAAADAEACRRKQQEEEAERRRQEQRQRQEQEQERQASKQRRRTSATAAVPAPAPSPPPNPLAAQLAEMGFPLAWCQRALDAVGGGPAASALGAALGPAGAELLLEEALNWILANGELLAEEDEEEEEGEKEEEEVGEAKEGEDGEAPPPSDPSANSAGPPPEQPPAGEAEAEAEEPEPTHDRPVLYHVDPSAELFLTLYDEPSTESEPVHTVFSGEELYVVARSGPDWLCVNLDYDPEVRACMCVVLRNRVVCITVGCWTDRSIDRSIHDGLRLHPVN
jgi:hypothetical protein